MNETIRFVGTSESSFESIMRRSLVLDFKARFLSEADLMAMFPDGHGNERGFFPQGPITEGLSRVLLTMILGFLAGLHSNARRVSRGWRRGGGGTRLVMRRACNLVTKEKVLAALATAKPSNPEIRRAPLSEHSWCPFRRTVANPIGSGAPASSAAPFGAANRRQPQRAALLTNRRR